MTHPENQPPSATRAPDLENGFIVNAVTEVNSWTTEIQCVLTEDADGAAEPAYLGHECRNEHVPLMDDAGPSETVFMTRKPHEFLTYSRAGRFYQLPTTDTLVTDSAVEMVEKVALRGSYLFLPRGLPEWQSEVHCTDRRIEVIPAEEVLRGLNGRRLPMRRLFLRFDWREGEQAHTIHCPCRYVNFANESVAKKRYLQPITGHVLFPSFGTLLPGYFVCARAESGETRAEFVTPRYADACATLATRHGVNAEDADSLQRIGGMLPSFVRVFDFIYKVEGTLTFYTYAD